MNTLIKILEAFPDKPWNLDFLMANPNISIEYAESHPKLSLNLHKLSSNPHLTMSYIINHPEIEWNWFNISKNPGITLADIDGQPNTLLGINNPEQRINLQNIEDYPWNWRGISCNPNITMEFILKHADKYDTPRKCHLLGGTPNITPQDIKNYPNFFPNKIRIFEQNPHFTLDDVFDDCEKEDLINWVDFSNIGKNIKNIQDILNKNDKYSEIFRNNSFIAGFSENPNITIDIIKQYNIWNWWNLCKNPSITMKDLETFEEDNLCPEAVSQNPNITYEWIEKYLDEIDWDRLSKNKFAYHEAFNDPIIIRI